MSEQRLLFRHCQDRCKVLMILIFIALMLWASLRASCWLLSCAGAAQLLAAFAAAAQVVQAAAIALITGLLYTDVFGALQAQRMRLGAAAERSLTLAARREEAARRDEAGSGGQQPSTP